MPSFSPRNLTKNGSQTFVSENGGFDKSIRDVRLPMSLTDWFAHGAFANACLQNADVDPDRASYVEA